MGHLILTSDLLKQFSAIGSRFFFTDPFDTEQLLIIVRLIVSEIVKDSVTKNGKSVAFDVEMAFAVAAAVEKLGKDFVPAE